MAETMESGSDVVKTKQSSRALVAVGVPAVLFTAVFAGRMVWEETFLTKRTISCYASIPGYSFIVWGHPVPSYAVSSCASH
jgi:hypothetical protein